MTRLGAEQAQLFGDDTRPDGAKQYRPVLTAVENVKGVLDVDTVKGCTIGMRVYPGRGCYGECYASKTASMYGMAFAQSITRRLTKKSLLDVFLTVKNHRATWYRIGVSGDPCHDWNHTATVCEALIDTGKTPVIVTKHWIRATDEHLVRFKAVGAVFNTSVSGLDTEQETRYRLAQHIRLIKVGICSVLRVVTCKYGTSDWARMANDRQQFLLSLSPVIDNPLRVSKTNPHVLNGDIIVEHRADSVGGGKLVSVNDKRVYLGHCSGCPDQCGVIHKKGND